MIEMECAYEPPHTHQFPDDWEFGGARGMDPRADRRWRPTTYLYLDDHLHVIETTQTPLCDDQALDEFTKVRDYGPGYRPAFLQAKRPDGTLDVLDWQYNPDTDELSPLGG